MKELEVITIGSKDYSIIKEAIEDEVHYVFLSNVVNPEDIMIRKSSPADPNLYIPLADEDEFYLANLLLFKDTCEE